MNEPCKYEVVTEFWNGKIVTEPTNDLTLNDNRLGIVNETWYIDTRYEAKLRLYNYLRSKGKEGGGEIFQIVKVSKQNSGRVMRS